MKYGAELVAMLEKEIETTRAAMQNRRERIDAGMTDEEDCFISIRCEERGIRLAEDKIELIKAGGTAWFVEYATLSGELVSAKWCNTRFGSSLRVEMPDGSVVWTTAGTKNGLAKRGLKMVECRRPAWFAFHSSARGMLGVYTGEYVRFPSDVNFATGEPAGAEPLEMRDAE